ncbi:hypothetical protein [Sphingobium sp. TomTYG45]
MAGIADRLMPGMCRYPCPFFALEQFPTQAAAIIYKKDIIRNIDNIDGW